MKRTRIAIVGAGFSGATLAASLMRRGAHAPDVVLVGREKRFGPGLAYGDRDGRRLMNARASAMSAVADEPDHFARWLAGQGQREAPACFARRSQYGAYLEQLVRRAHARGATLKRVRGDVVSCRRADEGWRLTLAAGKSIDADAAVLASGHAPPQTPPIFEHSGIALIDAWDARALARLPGGDVLLLGAGLSMIDVALTLVRQRNRGVIYALSRRGQMPRAHLDSTEPPQPASLDLPLPLSAALHAFRAEVKAMAARGEPWQHAVDRLRARTPELWRRLPRESQQRFLRHLRVWWDVHRHRAAPEIAAQVKALQEGGRLKVLAGEIVSVAANGRGVRVQHRGRGSLVRHNMDLAGVVNCTGAALDPALSTQPLVHQLMAEGFVRAHANGLGYDVDDESRLIDASGAAHADLFALGPITQGAFWEATAVPEIRVRAAAIAAMLAPGSTQ